MENIEWEYKYKVIRLPLGDFDGWLNDLGKSGWELVSTIYENHQIACFFKRPKLKEH